MPTQPVRPPAPDSDAAQHSARVFEYIQRDIAQQGGWITFARYMELALYAPGLGYYTAGARKFGVDGDFVTAPEISPLFGRTLAKSAAQIMAHSAPHVLELGAGSGKLAVDMLTEFERFGCLPDSYSILEVSADLRARQQILLQQRLPHLLPRVHWLDKLPHRFSGAVIANEVLDALPVHLVRWRDGTQQERGVALGKDGLVWQKCAIRNTDLLKAVQQIKVPDEYLSEICLASRGLINSLAQCLQQGAMLFIDYGFGAKEFYHPQRSRGTLMCHYRHYAHDDVFFWPGLQDITAHVNFSDIAGHAVDAGLDLIGYTNQAFFLINGGITDLLKETPPENLRDYLPLSGQLQKLTSPAEMGELFKVIALGKNCALKKSEGSAGLLSGFAAGDLSRTL
ncbi:MAG TPA: SAM-dependent methyltransferase [Gallionella sp.]|nr:SAM-dependent methyltransferase [Gallionella sp.]